MVVLGDFFVGLKKEWIFWKLGKGGREFLFGKISE
jgi:hypothetical protein